MLTQMSDDLNLLADKLKVTRDEIIGQLKGNYDGYHFTWPSPDLYNPFSLLNAFADGKMNSYWFGSGTPTYLIEMLNQVWRCSPTDRRTESICHSFRCSNGTDDGYYPVALPEWLCHHKGLLFVDNALYTRHSQ